MCAYPRLHTGLDTGILGLCLAQSPADEDDPLDMFSGMADQRLTDAEVMVGGCCIVRYWQTPLADFPIALLQSQCCQPATHSHDHAAWIALTCFERRGTAFDCESGS